MLCRSAVVVGFAAAAMMVALPTSSPARIDKCQKKIQKETEKLEKKLFKALEKCTFFYRKQVVKNARKGLPRFDRFKGRGGVGFKCQKQLEKAWTFLDPDGKSKTEKAFAKLLRLTPPPAGTFPGREDRAKCQDADLVILGHLDTATFGDKWARWLLIRAQHATYTEMLHTTRDATNIFQILADESDCDTQGSVPDLCSDLTSPPCFSHACVLDAGSSTCVDSRAIDIPVGLSGVTTLNICDRPGIMPGDFAVIGSPSKALSPVPLGGAGTACVDALAAEGFIAGCNPTNPTVSYDLCQDHVLQCASNGANCSTFLDCNNGECKSRGRCRGATCSGGANDGLACATNDDCPDACIGGFNEGNACTDDIDCIDECVDECEVAFPSAICQPDVPDPFTGDPDHLGTNGGACLATSAAAPAPGEGFVINTTAITVVAPGEVGPDGDPCTGDDTATPGEASTIPLTTATGAVVLIDADAVDGALLPDGTTCPVPAEGIGSPFVCKDVEKSVLTGGSLGGAFPGLHALFAVEPSDPGADTVTTFTLSCG